MWSFVVLFVLCVCVDDLFYLLTHRLQEALAAQARMDGEAHEQAGGALHALRAEIGLTQRPRRRRRRRVVLRVVVCDVVLVVCLCV